MALVNANGTVAACAVRDIAEGEELTIAYGTKYWLMRVYPNIMGNGMPDEIATAISERLEDDEAIHQRIELEDALNDKITAAATIKWA